MSPDPGPPAALKAAKARFILGLRASGITDTHVLAAMEKVPRQVFTPEPFIGMAYDDITLPIGYQQTLSQPLVVAAMTQALEVGDRMKVLEIGTGSGYQTAILSWLCRRVYTIERHRALLSGAESRLATLRRRNVTAKPGDGSRGWPEQAPFERILVTAAAVDVPPVLVEQLAPGGVMVVPIGDGESEQRILRVRRTAAGLDIDDLGPVRFVPLVAGEPEAAITG